METGVLSVTDPVTGQETIIIGSVVALKHGGQVMTVVSLMSNDRDGAVVRSVLFPKDALRVLKVS